MMMTSLSSLLLKLVWFNLLLIRCASYKCSNRYEFKEEIKEAIPDLKDCAKVKIKYPICRRDIRISFTDHPPYVHRNASVSAKPYGLLPDMLDMVMDVCCYGCSKIIYESSPVNPRAKYTAASREMYMPLEGAMGGDTFHGYYFVPFLKVDGVSFLARDEGDKSHEYTAHLMESVASTWPLFITALLMAFAAGCAIWIFDMWFNDAEFPQRFPCGPFEGFWWAFVSMTTVGYGDKAPKSWIARIFSIIWILVGITVFSMYTSILTSSLGSKADSFGAVNFVHKKIGVLDFTAAGEAAAYEANAKLVKFKDVISMAKALKDNKIEAMAVDNFILRFYHDELHHHVPDIKKHHSVKAGSNGYGILSYDREFAELVRSFFKTNEDQRHALALHAMYHRWPDMKLPEEQKSDSSFLNHKSEVFNLTMAGLVIIAIVCCIIGLTCKFLFYKFPGAKNAYVSFWKAKCFQSNEPPSRQDITLKNYAATIHDPASVNELLRELDDFKSKWERHIVSRNNNNQV